MNYFYAQINQNDVCYAVSNTHSAIIQPDMIQLAFYDESVIGKRWTGGEWKNALESQTK